MSNQELLSIYRNQIDTLDLEIMNLLNRRFQIAQEIGNVKKETWTEILQEGRWNEVMTNLKESAKHTWLNEEFIENIWNEIHKESIRKQK